MRTPLSWLRDFAPIDADVERLTELLNELGLVVDGVSRVGEGLGGVVVARVEEIQAIEGADRIRAVVVDVGGTPTHVVCGAWNFAVGNFVALATVGTVLPGADFAIARRKMRGAESNGMLCSGAELGLSADHGGILVLPGGLETGVAFTEAIGLAPDVVFDLDITPNRPDAMSVAGVARDLAGAMRIPFAVPDRPAPALSSGGAGTPAAGAGQETAGDRDPVTGARVATEDASLCPLFTARMVEGLTVGTSPAWITTRLTLAGMRPINSVVDASNYVMLELGQPTHPYDLDLLAGPALVARAAREGEVLKTLDGAERVLGLGEHPDCVITDGDDRLVGIGGVMGGQSSEISEGTTRVLVEAAYFAPMAVARTSKRLGLRSEASARFERGTDPDIAGFCADRVAALAAGSGGGANLGAGLSTGHAPPHTRIHLRTARLNALLGTDLVDAVVHGHLERIGFGVSGSSPGQAEVEVPGWRPDVSAEVDLVEEVARHHGYARVARTVPTTTQVGLLSSYQRGRRHLRQIMAGAGLVEAWTPTLIGPDDHGLVGRSEEAKGLSLTNPMSREESELRRTMMPGLLRAVRFNVGHRNENIRLFEVGKVFAPPPAGRGLPEEGEQLAAVLAAPADDAAAAVRLWRTLADGLRLQDPGIRTATPPGLHPTRSGELTAGTAVVGVIGEVDPAVAGAFDLEGRLGWLQVDLEALAAADRLPAAVADVSSYPSSDVDLAFVIDEAVPAAEVESTLRRAAGELLIGLRLFDVFRDRALLGAGRRSLAWRLRFCALDHTLTDGELAAVRQTCVDAVQSAHPAVLRG